MTDEQQAFVPTGLTRRVFNQLSQSADEAGNGAPAHLLEIADEHLRRVREAHRRNSLINFRLAQAIGVSFRAIVADWERVSAHARPWLLGAMHYFAGDDDEEPDFASPIGFEDDAEVLNACLRLAGRDDLCLNTEDFDDV